MLWGWVEFGNLETWTRALWAPCVLSSDIIVPSISELSLPAGTPSTALCHCLLRWACGCHKWPQVFWLRRGNAKLWQSGLNPACCWDQCGIVRILCTNIHPFISILWLAYSCEIKTCAQARTHTHKRLFVVNIVCTVAAVVIAVALLVVSLSVSFLLPLPTCQVLNLLHASWKSKSNSQDRALGSLYCQTGKIKSKKKLFCVISVEQ